MPSSDTQTPLLHEAVDGCVDYNGRPVYRSISGGWRSAFFIIGSNKNLTALVNINTTKH